MIPTWQAESDSSIVSICSSACSAPGLALGGERLDPALAGPDERELGGDEEAVDRDEQKEQDEEERGHCSEPWGSVLRGRSSSTGTGQR